MLLSLHTLSKNSSASRTGSPRPAKTSDWPSTWKRLKSWAGCGHSTNHHHHHQLEVVHQFTYLGYTISASLPLAAEINKRIGKVATTLGRLTTRVWENPKLTTPTKRAVYNACIVSTLLYSSETWTTYSKQERKLNSFHMRYLRRILRIQWSGKVPNALISPPCLRYSDNASYVGLACAVWRMAVCQRTSSTANLPLATELLAAPNRASKMSASATWRPWTSTQRARKMQ